MRCHPLVGVVENGGGGGWSAPVRGWGLVRWAGRTYGAAKAHCCVAGFDLRQVSSEWRFRPLRTRSTRGTRLSARAGVWLMCPCTWVRCCLVFSVLFGGLLGDRE